jgi:hypothetical protein
MEGDACADFQDQGRPPLTGDTNTNIIVIDEAKTFGLDKSQ